MKLLYKNNTFIYRIVFYSVQLWQLIRCNILNVINSIMLNAKQESLVANETLESSHAVNQLMLSMHILFLSLHFI